MYQAKPNRLDLSKLKLKAALYEQSRTSYKGDMQHNKMYAQSSSAKSDSEFTEREILDELLL
ncbi:predicted protein [Sclerotinia sclerotiorum 1980 UF-70]|uniref:Uncharacterized protein n=1 Tax=Sclerotinia sclerotiorum (strain ATCC 18683 / 1980 / Ss-1) TaxID=665079 RepID=A7F846_SCLS1|nr:predicted protein [Sclerotinia sclerotiorum 1980 UF-70]EDN98917.1 predicted protein [Sclerotinia sclerotiorum 1980 UF-70]